MQTEVVCIDAALTLRLQGYGLNAYICQKINDSQTVTIPHEVPRTRVLHLDACAFHGVVSLFYLESEMATALSKSLIQECKVLTQRVLGLDHPCGPE